MRWIWRSRNGHREEMISSACAAIALTARSAPSARGSSTLSAIPHSTGTRPPIRASVPKYFEASSCKLCSARGTTEAITTAQRQMALLEKEKSTAEQLITELKGSQQAMQAERAHLLNQLAVERADLLGLRQAGLSEQLAADADAAVAQRNEQREAERRGEELRHPRRQQQLLGRAKERLGGAPCRHDGEGRRPSPCGQTRISCSWSFSLRCAVTAAMKRSHAKGEIAEMMLRTMAVAALLAATTAAAAPAVTEADFTAPNFRFSDGKSLPALKQHYRTLGTPVRNARGEIINAVMVGHGTGGTGAQFLVPQFARLLEPGGSRPAGSPRAPGQTRSAPCRGAV